MKKILIAEDDKLIADMYVKKFKKAGFEVDLAEDGQEVLRKAAEKIPDLILLDIVLPRKTGFEALKELKNNINLKQTKVVMLTNLGEAEDIKKGMELGADAYFVKAHSTPSEIVEKTEKILEEK